MRNRKCIDSVFFFFKQKTAYEMRISDWSSDVCSSDLQLHRGSHPARRLMRCARQIGRRFAEEDVVTETQRIDDREDAGNGGDHRHAPLHPRVRVNEDRLGEEHFLRQEAIEQRSEEHTSELQSLMRISYAVFCLKKKKHRHTKVS